MLGCIRLFHLTPWIGGQATGINGVVIPQTTERIVWQFTYFYHRYANFINLERFELLNLRTLISIYCVRFGRHFQSSGLNRLIQWGKQVEISGNY